MKKLYHGFCWIEETLCNIGFGAMIALVFISAIARNLGRPIMAHKALHSSCSAGPR